MPYFKIYGSWAAGYRWRLQGGNGEIVASGESYTTKQACRNAVEWIQENAPVARIIDEAA